MFSFLFGGIWYDRPAERSVLERMATSFPGSNSHAIEVDGAFGVCSSLSRAPSRESSQTSSEFGRDTVRVAMVGEIHNHIELRRHLQSRNHDAGNATDVEIVAAGSRSAVNEYGVSPDAPKRRSRKMVQGILEKHGHFGRPCFSLPHG